jgi:flagellar M-ring protein FliF
MRQLLLLVGIAAAVAAGVSTYTYTQKPGMAPLFSNLEAKDSAAVTDALRAANIDFQLDPVTGAVTVSGDKIHEARLKLAAAGLPKSSSMGFEMIQQEQGFGTSQFIESARYQHALETELARTVSSLQWVQSARVHLALPKQSVFAGGSSAASASVLVDLSAGRTLDSTQVASIVHLVASSVPNLSANNVTVIDQYGHLLNSSGDANDPARQADKQFDQARRLEADYVRRIEQLLMPMTGSGRVSAQVVADMDFSEFEEASESYKPDSAIVRSEQTSEDVTRGGAGANAQGIPGATSNQPPNAAQAQALNPPAALAAAGKAAAKPGASPATPDASAATPITENRNSTRNYEMDRTVSHVRRPGGVIKHLSVAVLVDNLPKADGKEGATKLMPLSKDEMSKVEELVKQAVGFDAKRGDTLSVQNAPFASDPIAPIEAIPLWQRPELRDIGRRVVGAIIVIALIFAVLKPAFKFLTEAPPAESISAMIVQNRERLEGASSQAALSGETQDTSPRIAPIYEQKLTQARSAVTQDPKRVAQVIKTWVNADG